MKLALATVIALAPLLFHPAHAGGSNYGIAPGTIANITGKVSEWPVPTPKFARDPAIAPDGSIFITVMSGNKIARFDTKTHTFQEWDMPAGHRPHGLLVDKQGMVWTTGNGNGTIGKHDPASGATVEYKTPSGRGGPHTLVITDDESTIWFTMQSGDKVASIDTKTGTIKVYAMPGGPYAVNTDGAGIVWVNEINTDTVVRFDPKSEQMRVVKLPSTGVGIRKMVVDAQGKLWYMGSHNGRLGVVE